MGPAVYHDALGSYWMIGRSGIWDGFFDPTTQFLTGTDYQALDSYTLWLSAQVLSFRPTCIVWTLDSFGTCFVGWRRKYWLERVGSASVEFDGRIGVCLFGTRSKCAA